MRRILIQSYPNREIRVVYCRQQLSVRETHETKDDIDKLPGGSSSLTCHSLKTRDASTKPQIEGILELDGKPGWGGLPRFQRFSTYARRQILRAGGALERVHPHHECLFLTLTLPGSTKAAMEALARYSGKAVKMLHDWIGKRTSSKLSIYSWEWQKRGALHLHYVVHCPDKEKGEYIRGHLKEQWIRILDAIGRASGVDLYKKNEGFSWSSNKEATRTDAQWCEKSVAAYLSKYVSKPKGLEKRFSKNAYCPSRWYGVSRPLLQLTREMSFSICLDFQKSNEVLAIYEDCLSLLQAFSLKCYTYKHKVGDGATIVSYSDVNEQASIWNHIMNEICPTPDSLSNTELNMRRLARNGCILLKKHPTWLKEFMFYYNNSRPAMLLNLPSFKDITRSDLVFLVDSLAYSFRSHQRVRFELPGAAKLWYSQMKETIDTAPSEDKEWIGALEL